MAQQNPGPSVQKHREAPVFDQIDSNTDDGFKDALRTDEPAETPDPFEGSEMLAIFLASHPMIIPWDYLVLQEQPEATVIFSVEHHASFCPLCLITCQFCGDMGQAGSSASTMERFSMTLGESYDANLFYKKLAPTFAWGMQTERKRSLDGEFCKSLIMKAIHFVEFSMYDSAPWKVRQLSSGNVRQIWMFRECRSEQQLLCQDFGDKSKRDMQGLSKSRLDRERRLKLLFFTRAAAHRENCKWRSKTPLDIGECPQNFSSSLHTGSNLCMILNLSTTELPQAKPMSSNAENNLSVYDEESCFAIGIELVETVDGKMISQKLDYSTCCNLNKHKETMPKDPMFQLDNTFNKHKRKETTKRVPSSVIFPIICLWILLVTRSQTASTHVQPLHKEHGPVSIGAPLLELFSFMVFVWAVAAMILIGAKFTRMHGAMFLFWAILMHVRLDNSTSVPYLPILGIFFVGWYACGKATIKGEKLSSTV